MDKVKPIEIRFIKIGADSTDRLDNTSKLERDRTFVDMLMAEGEKEAAAFLETNSHLPANNQQSRK
jgi:hypothetical protein